LARSDSSAAKLAQVGLTPVRGDFADAASLANAVKDADVIEGKRGPAVMHAKLS